MNSPTVTDDRDVAIDTPRADGIDASRLDELVVEELLVEEISIDGMCGVY